MPAAPVRSKVTVNSPSYAVSSAPVTVIRAVDRFGPSPPSAYGCSAVSAGPPSATTGAASVGAAEATVGGAAASSRAVAATRPPALIGGAVRGRNRVIADLWFGRSCTTAVTATRGRAAVTQSGVRPRSVRGRPHGSPTSVPRAGHGLGTEVFPAPFTSAPASTVPFGGTTGMPRNGSFSAANASFGTAGANGSTGVRRW